MKANEGYLFRAFYSKRVRHLHFDTDTKQEKEWENIIAAKGEGFKHGWGCCHGEAVGMLTRSVASYVIDERYIVDFL